jgi:DNA-binding NarL/FixJ family response regulator
VQVVVADDSVLFREGLVRVLTEHGHEVVDAVGDASALLDAVRERRPDLANVDVRMPPDQQSDGARAAATLRGELPQVGILLLSQHIELGHCLGLIGTAGFGYLLKDRVLDLAEFDAATRRVAAGGSALDPAIIQALVRSKLAPSALDGLTERERGVLSMVAQGHSNTTIAGMLFLSERTVEAHMRSIFTKLGLHDDGASHRRVLAVLRYLDAHIGSGQVS